jgi:hypothetical protein
MAELYAGKPRQSSVPASNLAHVLPLLLFMLTAPCLQSIFSGEAATEAAAQHEQGEQDLLEPLDIMP